MTKASQQFSLIALVCGAGVTACAAPSMAATVNLKADLKSSNEVHSK